MFADAPAWPSKPIKLVAVFPPGGSVDQVARVISQPLQTLLKQPPIADMDLTAEQQVAAKQLASGTRGGVFVPFVPLLRSPELMRRIQKTGEYLRYRSALPPRLSEQVILIVARWWNQGFEWHIHQPIALQAGVKAEVAAAIEAGKRPFNMTPTRKQSSIF